MPRRCRMSLFLHRLWWAKRTADRKKANINPARRVRTRVGDYAANGPADGMVDSASRTTGHKLGSTHIGWSGFALPLIGIVAVRHFRVSELSRRRRFLPPGRGTKQPQRAARELGGLVRIQGRLTDGSTGHTTVPRLARRGCFLNKSGTAHAVGKELTTPMLPQPFAPAFGPPSWAARWADIELVSRRA